LDKGDLSIFRKIIGNICVAQWIYHDGLMCMNFTIVPVRTIFRIAATPDNSRIFIPMKHVRI